MVTDKKRFSISLDDDLVREVEKYQHEKQLRHRSDALLELATCGLNKLSPTDCGIKKYHDLDNHGKRVVDAVIREEFTRMEQEQENMSIKEDMRNLTYFNELPASAGTGMPMYDGDMGYAIKLEVEDSSLTRRADFAIRVRGDSMEPDFSDDDIVLVKKDTVNVGDIGIFIINGDSYIKKLGRNSLISLNREYDDVPLCESDNMVMVGKVIGKL